MQRSGGIRCLRVACSRGTLTGVTTTSCLATLRRGCGAFGSGPGVKIHLQGVPPHLASHRSGGDVLASVRALITSLSVSLQEITPYPSFKETLRWGYVVFGSRTWRGLLLRVLEAQAMLTGDSKSRFGFSFLRALPCTVRRPLLMPGSFPSLVYGGNSKCRDFVSG